MTETDSLWMNADADTLDMRADEWQERQELLKELFDTDADTANYLD